MQRLERSREQSRSHSCSLVFQDAAVLCGAAAAGGAAPGGPRSPTLLPGHRVDHQAPHTAGEAAPPSPAAVPAVTDGVLQISVNVLEEQLEELQAAKEALDMSRRREDALQQQVKLQLHFQDDQVFFSHSFDCV